MKVSKVAWAVAYLLLSKGVFAATFNWIGMDKVNPHDWAFHENWAEGNPPSEFADLVFPSSSISYNPQHQTPLFSLNVINSMTISSSMEYLIEGSAGHLIPMGGDSAIAIDGSGTKNLTLQYLQLNAPTTITSDVSSAASPRQLNFISGEGRLIVSSPNGGSFLLNDNTELNGGVTLSSGTLLTGTTGLGSGEVILNDATILKPTSSFTLSNDMAIGEGSAQIDTDGFDLLLAGTVNGHHLVKMGEGELTLAKENHYADTTLNAGTIAIEASGALGKGIVTINPNTTIIAQNLDAPIKLSNPFILNGGILDTNDSTLELNGVISGGKLTKLNGGELVLAGANTYSEGTLLDEGILGVKNSSALGGGKLTLRDGTLLKPEIAFLNIPNDILLDGEGIEIDMNGQSHFTLSGSIDGPHALHKIGEGTLALSGTHTFSGGTNLAAGALELCHSQCNLGSGAVTLGAGTTLASSADVTLSNPLNLNGTQTIHTSNGKLSLAGPFSGGMELIKTGAGILELTASGTGSTDLVTVEEGQLAVHGALLSDVEVSAGAILSGTGIIAGDVQNFGKMAPGASVGTLTIEGDFTHANSSLYENEISLISSDLLLVQGDVTIEGNTTFQLFPNPETGIYIDGTTYTVIDTGNFGNVTGTFQKFTSTAPLVSGTLSYPSTGDKVFLTLKVSEVTSYISFGNGGDVATALNRIGGMAYPGIDGVFNSLSPLSEVEKTVAFNQMHPALYKGMALVQENNAVQVRSAVSERLQVVFDNKHRYIPAGEELPCETADRNFHFWMTAIGDLLYQADITFLERPQVGYHGNSGGFVVGTDYNFATYFYAGALVSYTHSDVRWNHEQGLGKIDSGYLGVYLSAIGKMFYGNFSMMGGWSEFDAQRNITYTGVNVTAKNSHNGDQLTTHLDTGINLGVKGFTIRPFDSLDWIIQGEDGFTETNAGEYNLGVNSTSANMLRNELGVNFAGSRCFNGTKASFDTKVGWVREVRLSGEDFESHFASTAAPVTFSSTGYFPNRNLLSVGASVSAVTLKDRLTITLYYNGAFGQKYSDNGMGGQLNLGF